MSFRLGLTGSIGMGKTTTARFFLEQGCAVWDADAAVHRLYSPGGAAVPLLRDAFPDVIENGQVARHKLRVLIQKDAAALRQLEEIVHPLVQLDRAEFVVKTSTDIQVFDIPLLFETGADREMDAVACVFIDTDIQIRRVLARSTMTKEQFEHVLQKQIPNEEKCARSDYQIKTDTLSHTQEQVEKIVLEIRADNA